jgi:hypothetical protein
VKSVTCNFDDSSMCGYLMVDSWKRTQHQTNSNGKIVLLCHHRKNDDLGLDVIVFNTTFNDI